VPLNGMRRVSLVHRYLEIGCELSVATKDVAGFCETVRPFIERTWSSGRRRRSPTWTSARRKSIISKHSTTLHPGSGGARSAWSATRLRRKAGRLACHPVLCDPV